jgi:hypothetical protein
VVSNYNVRPFLESLKMGTACEAAVRRLLEQRGWKTWDTAAAVERGGYGIIHAGGRRIRLDRPAGKGPRLLMQGAQLIAPDILAERGDDMRWIEVKRKQLGVQWNRTHRAWVTGIDAHCFDHYQRVQACTGWAVWLVIWHAPSLKPGGPQGWTANSLAELGKIGGPESQEARPGMPRLRYFWADRLRFLEPRIQAL